MPSEWATALAWPLTACFGAMRVRDELTESIAEALDAAKAAGRAEMREQAEAIANAERLRWQSRRREAERDLQAGSYHLIKEDTTNDRRDLRCDRSDTSGRFPRAALACEPYQCAANRSRSGLVPPRSRHPSVSGGVEAMGANTEISWADHTFNPWTGCTKVSPACDHCYAEGWAKRSGLVEWGNHPRRRTSEANWRQPLKWNREAAATGSRKRVFCASLADVFDNQVPEEWRADLWRLIDETPDLDWLILTKRPQNAAKMVEAARRAVLGSPDIDARHVTWPWPNVWLGTTVENQEEADRRIPHLLSIPAAKHFLSCEPLLETLRVDYIDRERRGRLYPLRGEEAMRIQYPDGGTGDFTLPTRISEKIDWVIVGGESGPGARPMHPEWARSLRDQCVAAGVPFHFKQWGDWLPGENYGSPLAKWQDGNEGLHPSPDHIEWRHFGTPGEYGAFAIRVGKKAAGRLLDGRLWEEMP